MTRELARIVEAFAAGEALSRRPEDRALAHRYLAELARILAGAVSGKKLDGELDAFERLLGTSWLVDAEPFQEALSRWHALFEHRVEPATPTESTIAHFAGMSAFVERASLIPAEVREHSWSYDAFGSWSVRLRCKGRVVRVLWDGREGELLVERALSRKAPYEWQCVASWASKTGGLLGPEVFEAVERAAG